MTINTYLGQRGYTISKAELSLDQQVKIRKELTVSPFTLGSPVNTIDKSFPAYRESPNQFFVPHYYGIENFGPPREYRLSDGKDINLTFNGAPRDYQEPVINKFLEHCRQTGYGGGLLELHTGWGKTSAGLYIASVLKKKTLIIIHKEFLMNQWIERIDAFLPGARIGKIQGPIIDIEDKDIVLCMLQSLVQKDYDKSIFAEFGLTIIDEVHHISSQSFSNSLFKVVTKYMLGLSATMDRKDGTTDIFKMFLGNVIHKAERKTDMYVEVRAVTYKVDDDDFNETILDFRGKPMNSSMISKVCEYSRRTEFIIKLLCDFIQVGSQTEANQHKCQMDSSVPNCGICNTNKNYLVRNACCDVVQYCLPCMENITNSVNSRERPKCPNCKKVLKYEQNYIENPYVKPLEQTQVIVMAQNLNILNYMYNKFVCKNLASVGYYVGGMSEAELKKSERKQIVLSTYQMASEGLDIPSLNAQFLITSKTDIVQSVGRILRAKHAFSHPIIYDIVDSHDLFQRQWLKRKSYYKKQNYKIIGTNSVNYNTNYSSWKVICNHIEATEHKAPKVSKPKANKDVKTERSITDDDDTDSEDDAPSEVCLLKIK